MTRTEVSLLTKLFYKKLQHIFFSVILTLLEFHSMGVTLFLLKMSILSTVFFLAIICETFNEILNPF